MKKDTIVKFLLGFNIIVFFLQTAMLGYTIYTDDRLLWAIYWVMLMFLSGSGVICSTTTLLQNRTLHQIINRQIEFFGSDKFMFSLFGLFITVFYFLA